MKWNHYLLVISILAPSPVFVFAQDRMTPQPQVRYELRKDSLPQDDTPAGKLEGPFLHHSQIIADTVRQYWVFVPAQYDPAQPANVFVFQDGARAINPKGVIRAPEVLENLIAKKQIPVTIGIFITPGQRGSEFPDSIGTGNPNNRDREYDVLTDAYARMLVEEILPAVGEKYNLTDDPKKRVIGGSSSGGICAFTVAWEMPDQFANVISFIGSFTDIHGGHVYPELIKKAETKPIRVILQDGVNDLRSPNNLDRDWHLQNRKMVAALTEKGYDFAYIFGEGGHSDDHGGAILPEMLRWIWRDADGIEQNAEDLIETARAVKPIRTELFPGFDAAAKVDPSGTWTWDTQRGPRVTKNSLKILSEDGNITGTLTFEIPGGDPQPEPVAIQNPIMEGNKLTFDVVRSFGDRSFTSTYSGIVHDNSISGWQMINFGGQQRDSSWQATK